MTMMLEISLGIGGAVVAYVAACRVYDDWHARVMNARADRVRLDAMKQRAVLRNLRHLPADENGRGGWVVSSDGRITNLDTRAVFDRWQVHHIDPVVERLDRVERALLAARGVSGATEQILDRAPDDLPQLPEYIPQSQLLSSPPTYRRLVLGQALSSTGQPMPVTADLADLVHVAIGGSSGWGKSVFLRFLTWQLVHSTESVQVALVDLEGATLAPFAKSSCVLWPLADTEQDALAVFGALTDELNRRRELYADYPGVDSLYRYNEQADDPLLPLVAIVDEATALLGDKDVESHLRTLALRARKYGLWLILAGQDWKASSLDTAIRNQLATRIQFRAMSASQSRVLLERSGAEEIEVRGRALASLPGRDMIEFQAPAFEVGPMRGNGPMQAMPEQKSQSAQNDRAEHILELADQGLSDTAIAREVFGYANGYSIDKVRAVTTTT